ncbi:hypothetical protein FA15DRAFT_546699, partial [Coprinopsis marcescibilis]
NTPTNNERQLRIWQQNINKSLIGQMDLLVAMKRKYDICAIQEPYIDFLGLTWANSNWTVIYPHNHTKNPKATRSLILVSAKISSDAWTPLVLNSQDVTGIEIYGDFGTIRIFNVYNNCKHNDAI